ncbi:MAG: alpha/beta fold hydrolase [Microthrixaceae bacterium]
MTISRTNTWRLAFVAGGAAMAIGGPLHPESDATDSLRDELATMTSGGTWVLSHSLIALGTALLAIGLWSAFRSDAWPRSTRTALKVAAVTMSLYVIETIFHLASVVDSEALAAGDAAPVAFTHVGLALVLYPVSGLAFAWLSARLFRVVGTPEKVFGVVGVVAGLLHAASVPMTVVLPDAELTPMFAGAGMLFAAWSLGLGISGLRTVRTAQPSRVEGPAAYRSAELALWHSLGVEPSEREVELRRLGTRVRIQELGVGVPILFIHGGPSAGTNWAPLAARLDGFRSIIVDRPGSGLSDALPVDADGLGHFADEFVVDLLDGLGLERAHVVASSFGGFLALRAAAVAPHRFDRMVQMACPAGAPGMAVPSFMRAAAVPMLRRLITTLPPNERAARSMLRQIGHGATLDAGDVSPQFMDWYLSLQRDTDTMRNDMALIGSLVTRRGGVHPALGLSDDLLGRVEVPTHFHWGADDPFGGDAVAVRCVAAMPHASMEIVDDAGHLPWLDDPQRAATAVRGFLERPMSSSPGHGSGPLGVRAVRIGGEIALGPRAACRSVG